MSEVTKTLTGTTYLVQYTIGRQISGTRLDRFLMRYYRSRSREQIKRAIEVGAVTIDRLDHMIVGKMKPSLELKHGDVVNVLSKKRREPDVDFNYKILYEDDELIVIDKPANLPVHPAGKYFFNTLLVHLKTKGFTTVHDTDKAYYLVHRIDRETSGILILAKTKEACNKLTSQFRNRETKKYYLAIGRGTPAKDSFDVDHGIGSKKGGPIGIKMYSIPESEGGLASFTHFEKIETRENFTLLACFPHTGRQHQIRVHAEYAGLPLVGDKLYGMSEEDCLELLDYHTEYREMLVQGGGDEVADEPDAEEFEDETTEDMPLLPKSQRLLEIEESLLLPRHALHAAGLRFKHPRTNEDMVFELGLPPDLKAFFEGLTGQKLAEFKAKHW